MQATKDMTAAFETVPAKIDYVTHALDKYASGLGQAYKTLMTNSKGITKGEMVKMDFSEGSQDM
jgi:hypothetical protein